MVETIMLTENRFLAVAWKDGKVHHMWLATSARTAQEIAERSLSQKPAATEVYLNIEKLVRALLLSTGRTA